MFFRFLLRTKNRSKPSTYPGRVPATANMLYVQLAAQFVNYSYNGNICTSL